MDSTYAQQGDTVDLICWRYYGRTDSVTEAVYQANPGLADLGPVLPHGTKVYLPEQSAAAPADTRLKLWD